MEPPSSPQNAAFSLFSLNLNKAKRKLKLKHSGKSLEPCFHLQVLVREGLINLKITKRNPYIFLL